MRYLSILLLLLALPAFSQNLAGKWLVYEGDDGSELVVTVSSKGIGQAEFSHVSRIQAVSYGEGSQFWGTFRTTGGYYFLVKGVMSEKVHITQTDSTVMIVRRSEPAIAVTAWLDEAYSTRELSDYGDYKKQVVAQWKRDLPGNEGVKEGKIKMEHFLADYYGDAFDFLLEGSFRIVERTDSSIALKSMDRDLPIMRWRRIQKDQPQGKKTK